MRVLSYAELRSRKGIPYHEVHIRRLVRAGKFPEPVELGPGRVAFREEDVDRWLESRRPRTMAKAEAPNAAY